MEESDVSFVDFKKRIISHIKLTIVKVVRSHVKEGSFLLINSIQFKRKNSSMVIKIHEKVKTRSGRIQKP